MVNIEEYLRQNKPEISDSTVSAYTVNLEKLHDRLHGTRSLLDLAGAAFKFMLFSKVMSKNPDDCLNLINSSISLNYQNRDVEAMKAVAQAAKAMNLLMFEKCK